MKMQLNGYTVLKFRNIPYEGPGTSRSRGLSTSMGPKYEHINGGEYGASGAQVRMRDRTAPLPLLVL